MSTHGAGARHGILNLAVKDKAHLHGAWMPYVKGGGIFVASTKRFSLGDEVFLLLSLPESSDKYPVPGKVIWVTPSGPRATAPPASACSSPKAATPRPPAPASRRCWPA